MILRVNKLAKVTALVQFAALLALAAASSSSAYAAGFDCQKASTAVESTICRHPDLSSLDDRLNIAWAITLAQTQTSDFLRMNQNEWLAQRNACGPDVDCLRASYQRRLQQLLGTKNGITPEFPWAQTWVRDPSTPADAQNEAHIIIGWADSMTRIRFTAEAWHGQNNMKRIQGEAIVRGDGTAHYASADGCRLDLAATDDQLVVTQHGACGYGIGNSLDFSGTYLSQ